MRWAVFLIESIETSCSRRAFDPCLQVTTLMAFATESDKTRVLFEHAVSDLTYDADGATVRVVPVQASPVGDPIPKPVYVKFRQCFLYFGCFEPDLRRRIYVRGAAFSCLRLKLADIVLI